MTIIAMPTSANLVKFSIVPVDNVQVNRSSWTGRRQVTALTGAQYWKANFSPHELFEKSQIKEWRAFLIKQRGGANAFNLIVERNQRIGSNPTVAAGATNGNNTPLQSLPANSLILQAGDYMTVPLPSGHKRLVMLENDLVSNSSGRATAQFWPLLNEVPAANQTVETINPFCPMALSSSGNGWQYDNGRFSIAFEAEEAL